MTVKTLQYIQDYDYENDTLYLKMKGQKVDYTVDIKNILFDVGDNQVVGIEFLETSDFLDVDKDFLNSLKYFEVHLDTYEWEDILLEIRLWNKNELMKEEKKTIKADLSEREGLPSNHFKFGNYKGLKRENSKSNLQIETPLRVVPGVEKLIDGIIAKKDTFAGFLFEREIRGKVEKKAYMRIKRDIVETEYNKEGNKIKEWRSHEAGERVEFSEVV